MINEKLKKFFSWLLMLLAATSIILLFVFQDSLVNFTSKSLQNQITPISKAIFADSVNQLYNYNNNGKKYKYTLLEFGAQSCVSCLKMEKVLNEITQTHNEMVNVVFFNMTKPRGLQYGKYFGVVMIPTQIILDKEGKEIHRNTGFILKNDLLLLLD